MNRMGLLEHHWTRGTTSLFASHCGAVVTFVSLPM